MQAELYAATQGCNLLDSIAAILDELAPGVYKRVLAIDNTSAAAMCRGGPGSQRTRHLKIRAHYFREATELGLLEIRHTPMTKVRLRQLLGFCWVQNRRDLGYSPVEDPSGDPHSGLVVHTGHRAFAGR